VIVLLGLEGRQTHQMKGVREVWIYRESPLTAKLGIKQSSGLQMIEAGFAKRRGAADTA
jgi:hypothetical protein